jgi:hypothetical protein
MTCPICYNPFNISLDLRRSLYMGVSMAYPLPLSPDSERCSKSRLHHTNNPQIIHNAITTAIMIPDSLNIATLFPAAAMRPSRPAEPLRDVLIDEKVSDYKPVSPAPYPFALPKPLPQFGARAQTYRAVNNILRPRIVVDVYCDAAQGGYFGRKL